jgi:hypothetical protein
MAKKCLKAHVKPLVGGVRLAKLLNSFPLWDRKFEMPLARVQEPKPLR